MKTRVIRTTLLELVQRIQDYAECDDEVVAVVAFLVDTGRVRLAGNFAGRRIALAIAA